MDTCDEQPCARDHERHQGRHGNGGEVDPGDVTKHQQDGASNLSRIAGSADNQPTSPEPDSTLAAPDGGLGGA